MKSPRQEQGFALMQIVLAVGVLTILAGLAVDGQVVGSDVARAQTVQRELAVIQSALESYYADHGAFPSDLDSSGFYGTYLDPGARDGSLCDEWGARAKFKYVSTATDPDVVVVYSVGEDGADDGPAGEDLLVTVQGRVSGDRRTSSTLALVAEVRRQFLLSHPAYTSGPWKVLLDRVAAETELDAYGTAIRIDPDGQTIRSAGADRTFSTADDLTQVRP